VEDTRLDVVALFREAAFEVGCRRFESLTLDTQFSELGLDSITVLETMGFFEDRLGVRFNDDELSRLMTLRDLEALIRKARQTA
jgi:acyl carrier protein